MIISIKNCIKNITPDSIYLRWLFYKMTGCRLNLNNPESFNEKLQWVKIYDRRPEYTMMVDKYAVKQWVSSLIGSQYVIPTLQIWESCEDIRYDILPEKFVIKATHDSGSVFVCKDKSRFDFKSVKDKLEISLKHNFYYDAREWPYKYVKPRIIAESYIQDPKNNDLLDYKIFCFNGIPKLIQVDYDRFSNHKRNLYTTDWKYIPVEIQYPTDPNHVIDKPMNLELMLNLAEKLSRGIPHVRVDFYNISGKIYFGEMTFYHGGGMEKFTPESFGIEMGNWINLPRG